MEILITLVTVSISAKTYICEKSLYSIYEKDTYVCEKDLYMLLEGLCAPGVLLRTLNELLRLERFSEAGR